MEHSDEYTKGYKAGFNSGRRKQTEGLEPSIEPLAKQLACIIEVLWCREGKEAERRIIQHHGFAPVPTNPQPKITIERFGPNVGDVGMVGK